MAKRPAFQFYPGDWQRDTALRCCSVAARGLWIDMLCIMHQGEPYGHLTVKGTPLEPQSLGRMVGASPREITAWLAELEGSQVFSRTATGSIFSRRMVKDEQFRQQRAACGKLGGNPSLVGEKVNQDLNHDVKVDPTPSSSSSSSSSPSGIPLPPWDPVAFGMAWQTYPARGRTKREAAIAAWRLAIQKLEHRLSGPAKAQEWLIQRVKDFAKSPKANTKYVTSIAAWLEGGSYDDDPAAWLDHDHPTPPPATRQAPPPRRDITPILPT